jgi:hypothetical protein
MMPASALTGRQALTRRNWDAFDSPHGLPRRASASSSSPGITMRVTIAEPASWSRRKMQVTARAQLYFLVVSYAPMEGEVAHALPSWSAIGCCAPRLVPAPMIPKL